MSGLIALGFKCPTTLLDCDIVFMVLIVSARVSPWLCGYFLGTYRTTLWHVEPLLAKEIYRLTCLLYDYWVVFIGRKKFFSTFSRTTWRQEDMGLSELEWTPPTVISVLAFDCTVYVSNTCTTSSSTGWLCQKLAVEQPLPGHGIWTVKAGAARTVHHSTNHSCTLLPPDPGDPYYISRSPYSWESAEPAL